MAVSCSTSCQLAADRDAKAVVEPGMIVNADPSLLRDILANLLGNAWKFTRGHATARIEVGAMAADGEGAYFVRDDGAGFDMAHAEHLFGAFQRMHGSDECEGNGIGLATAERLVSDARLAGSGRGLG